MAYLSVSEGPTVCMLYANVYIAVDASKCCYCLHICTSKTIPWQSLEQIQVMFKSTKQKLRIQLPVIISA